MTKLSFQSNLNDVSCVHIWNMISSHIGLRKEWWSIIEWSQTRMISRVPELMDVINIYIYMILYGQEWQTIYGMKGIKVCWIETLFLSWKMRIYGTATSSASEFVCVLQFAELIFYASNCSKLLSCSYYGLLRGNFCSYKKGGCNLHTVIALWPSKIEQ